MQRSLVPTLFALPVCVLLLSAPPAHAQLKSPLRLGAPIPASLDNADKHEKRCHTSDTQVDPCTEVKIGSIRCTIAWDEQTKAITYLFTDDRSLVTDNGLAVGNSLRLSDAGQSDTTVPYMKWMIDPKWKDTDARMGTAVWYAVLHKDSLDHHFGDVVGFVQSRYIQLKP
jgi:hypothetical protein